MTAEDSEFDKHARLRLRVYYEDTDAGGLVYYANYLRYFERARTEWLRALGFEQNSLMIDAGIAFAARSAQIEYLKPARLDDELEIVSSVAEVGRAQVNFVQKATRGGEILVHATIRIACLNPARGRAVAMPKPIYRKLRALL